MRVNGDTVNSFTGPIGITVTVPGQPGLTVTLLQSGHYREKEMRVMAVVTPE